MTFWIAAVFLILYSIGLYKAIYDLWIVLTNGTVYPEEDDDGQEGD